MERLRNIRDIEKEIELGESSSLDFKEKISNKIVKDMCAFLNFRGGRLLVGVSDKGEIVGVEMDNKTKSALQDIFGKIEPKGSRAEIYKVKNVIVIDIPRGEEKPYMASGNCYIREGANSQKLKSHDEIKRYFNMKNDEINFDEKINDKFNVKEHFNKNAFLRFRRDSKIKAEDQLKILKSRGFIEYGKFNNCGVLFFCKNIENFYQNCSCDCILYMGSSETKILDKKTYRKDIVKNFENALNYLEQKLNTSYEIKRVKRREILEIPEVALREILLNAFGHRDYNVTSNISVKIYFNRVEIMSPGKCNIPEEELGESHSIPRNPLLFNKFSDMHLVERAGDGIKKARRELDKLNLKYKTENGSKWFKWTIYRNEPANEPANAGNEPAKEKSEPANAGNEPAKEKSEPANAGNEPAKEKSEPANAGNEPANAGNEPANAGGELAKEKSEPANAGNEPAKEKSEPANAGNEPAKEKSEPANAGNEPAKEKSEPANAGNEPAKEKSEPANAGKKEERKKQIVEIIRKNEMLNVKNIVGIMKWSEATIKRDIRELKEEGKIEFLGSKNKKVGGYCLK